MKEFVKDERKRYAHEKKKGRGKNFWKSMKSLEHLKDRIEKKFLNEERGCAECEKSSAFYFFATIF